MYHNQKDYGYTSPNPKLHSCQKSYALVDWQVADTWRGGACPDGNLGGARVWGFRALKEGAGNLATVPVTGKCVRDVFLG